MVQRPAPLLLLLGASLLPVALLPVALRAQSTAPTGEVSIESDVQRADNVTGVITATGNVRIAYPERRVVATARQAQYFSREGRVVLSGDVDVVQADGPSIRAERIVYLVDQQRFVAEPPQGSQVLSRFPIAPLQGRQPQTQPPAPR
jgi:lipopolysaccharide export system protein LptA